MISVAALDAILYSGVSLDISSSTDYQNAWHVLVEWMGPSSTGCQTPNEQVMSAFSYLPELEKQLIENYEGAVSTHFAVHVSPLLQLGGEPETKTNCDRIIRNLEEVLVAFKSAYDFPLGVASFSDESKERFGRTFAALVRISLPRERLVDTLTAFLEKHPLYKESESTITARRIFVECGLIGEVQEALSRALVTEVTDHIKAAFTGEWEGSVLDQYDSWLLENIVIPVTNVFSNGSEPAGSELHKILYNVGLDALVELRTSELFDIIIGYPNSLGALKDLKSCLTTPEQRANVVSVFQKSCKRRLLQGGANTVDIISCYISTIRAFCLLDPRGVLLDKVSRPIRRYLKERDDTIRVLISGLLGESSSDINFLSKELASSRKAQILAMDDDLADLNWVPDPLDAPSDFRKGLPSDIVGSLISLYDNKEVFVKEFTAVFANRLLTNRNSVDEVVYNLELLKLRFDERELQNLDVMVKDVMESKRFDNNVRARRQLIDDQFHAAILSRLFWPPFKRGDLLLPGAIQEQIDQYSRIYSDLKPRRKLIWLPSLGSVTVELEFKDRVQEFLVSPDQAAFIGAFQDDKKSAIVLGQELGIGEIAVHELGGFWVSKGVLKRTGEQYEVLETVDKQRNTEGDAVMLQSVQTSEERSAEEMKVYWQYIVGMLTNLGCLPTERIHSFLKMLVPRETPYTKSSNELEQFLLLMVDEGNLEATSAGYKLLKQS